MDCVVTKNKEIEKLLACLNIAEPNEFCARVCYNKESTLYELVNAIREKSKETNKKLYITIFDLTNRSKKFINFIKGIATSQEEINKLMEVSNGDNRIVLGDGTTVDYIIGANSREIGESIIYFIKKNELGYESNSIHVVLFFIDDSANKEDLMPICMALNIPREKYLENDRYMIFVFEEKFMPIIQRYAPDFERYIEKFSLDF